MAIAIERLREFQDLASDPKFVTAETAREALVGEAAQLIEVISSQLE